MDGKPTAKQFREDCTKSDDTGHGGRERVREVMKTPFPMFLVAEVRKVNL